MFGSYDNLSLLRPTLHTEKMQGDESFDKLLKYVLLYLVDPLQYPAMRWGVIEIIFFVAAVQIFSYRPEIMFPSCEDAAHSEPTGAATRGDASWINKSQLYIFTHLGFSKHSIDIRCTCCAALAGCIASSIFVVWVRAHADIIGERDDVEEVKDPLGSLALACLVGLAPLTQLGRVIEKQQEKPLAIHLLDWVRVWYDYGRQYDQ